MSTLPNATNSAPGTTYSTGGGSGNFPDGIDIAGQNIVKGSYFNDSNVLVVQDDNGAIRPLNANPLLAGSYSAGYSVMQPNSISFVQPATGTTTTFATYDQATTTNIALSNISSINGAPVGGGGGGLTTVNVGTSNVKGGGVNVDPNSTTVIGSDSISALPTGSNILVQATIGIGSGVSGSNVTGNIQYGVGFSNALSLFSAPIYIDTNGTFPFVSSIQISGILANADATNTLLLIGSNAASNGLLFTAELVSLSMTAL
jgi:hypothetical protein